MKSIILYAYPPELDGLSIQGDLLYRGMKEIGEEVVPCNWQGGLEKEWYYKHFKPDIAIGIGFWGYIPDIVLHPAKFNITAIPWLVADGWVANYHDILSNLPIAFVTSDWVKETYARDGVDTNNFETLPIGFDPNIYKSIPKNDKRIKKIRQLLGVADDEVMILTIGGDVTSKGAQEVLQALKIVDKHFKKWKYVCKTWTSESAYNHHKEEMRLIDNLALPKNRIIFLEGSYSRQFMSYLLNACDVYAAPSRLEGFGLLQLEAQACGIPVLSIAVMGPAQTIIHGKTGFLAKVATRIDLTEEWVYRSMGFDKKKKIQFKNPKTFAYRASVPDIAKYLLLLMKNKKLRTDLGGNAAALALAKFQYKDIAAQAVKLIKKRLKL